MDFKIFLVLFSFFYFVYEHGEYFFKKKKDRRIILR